MSTLTTNKLGFWFNTRSIPLITEAISVQCSDLKPGVLQIELTEDFETFLLSLLFTCSGDNIWGVTETDKSHNPEMTR
jgi:hypothetical protein